MTRFRSTAVAVLLVSAALVNIAWVRSIQQATANVEVRDENGNVRCRLGRLDGSGYGLQLLGADGSPELSLSVDKDAWVLRGAIGTKDGLVRLAGGKDGTEITLGQSTETCVRLGLKATGEFSLVHSTPNSGELLVIRSDADKDKGGRSVIQLGHPSKDGPASGVALVADGKGASVDLLRGDRSTAQVASMTEGMSYLLLGARNFGVYLQAAANGNLLFELCNKTPRLSVQSTDTGTGIAIDRKDGSSAVRLGLSKIGELARNLFDDKGQKLSWDTK